MRLLLFRITPAEPGVDPAVGLLVVAAGVMTCLYPAVRASRLNAADVLKSE